MSECPTYGMSEGARTWARTGRRTHRRGAGAVGATHTTAWKWRGCKTPPRCATQPIPTRCSASPRQPGDGSSPRSNPGASTRANHQPRPAVAPSSPLPGARNRSFTPRALPADGPLWHIRATRADHAALPGFSASRRERGCGIERSRGDAAVGVTPKPASRCASTGSVSSSGIPLAQTGRRSPSPPSPGGLSATRWRPAS